MKRLRAYSAQLLLGAAALAYFLPLGWRALWDSDEGRYAEIGREMLELRQWVSPHLNYVLYFEKPPLMYWLIAGTERLLGANAFAARFWCAAFAVLTVGLTYRFGRRWKTRRAGLLAGAILGSSVLFVALSQFLVLDMALTFWTTLELFAFSGWLEARTPAVEKRFSYLAAAAAAGGVLTKGPVALILPGVALVLALVITGRKGSVRNLSWAAVGLFALLAAPWFIAVSLCHPFFLSFFFVREHVARFFTNIHQRNQPIYFFLVTLLVGFLPWSAFLPTVLWRWLQRRGAALKRDATGALLVSWITLVFFFFSASHSKLVGYLLPIFPALAVLLGDAFDREMDSERSPLWIQSGLVALAFLFIGLLTFLKWPRPPAFLLEEPASRMLAQSGYVALVLALGVFILVGVWGMRQTRTAFAGVILVQLLLLSSVFGLARELDPYLSAKGIAATLTQRALPKDPVVAYGVSYENHLQSFLFYSRRRLKVMGDPGELAMGAEHDPDAATWFVSEQAASSALQTLSPDTWVITDEAHWKALDAGGQSNRFALIERQGNLLLLQKVE